MTNTSLPLEAQFDVQRLKLHLQTYPEQAEALAISHFEDYLALIREFKKLEQETQSPSLSPIPTTRSHARLQAKYDNLQSKYMKLLMDHAHLRSQNQDLMELVSALTN